METTRGHFCGALWPKYAPNLAGVCCEEPRLKAPGSNTLIHGHTPAGKKKTAKSTEGPLSKTHKFWTPMAPWSRLARTFWERFGPNLAEMSRECGTKKRSFKDG